MRRFVFAFAGLYLFPLTLASAPARAALDIDHLGSYSTGVGAGSAEISAYDAATKRLFVTNSVGLALDVVDFSNPALPVKINSIPLGGDPTHVSARGGIVAVGIVAPVKTDPGSVQLYSAADWGPGAAATPALATLTVGALPDMVAFTPDGSRLLVANEGEPSLTADPEGSVSIIDLTGGAAAASVAATATFTAFNGQEAALRAEGVRIYPDPAGPPGVTVAQDLEPEFISIAPDSSQAFVTLQEANAIAVVDLATNQISEIQPLGLKDHALVGSAMDPSDRDGAGGAGSIFIRNVPVKGMFQPDGVASFSLAGQTYYATANEGDSRTFEEIRVGVAGYVLDPTVFPNFVTLKGNASLGRLQLTRATGDLDGDGDFDEIHALGARSFSIWNANGSRVFDSGDQFEQRIATLFPTLFNSEGAAATFDTRSDNKGPEPEGIAVAEFAGRTYAFIGLERVGGFMVYDVTTPASATFVEYVRDPAGGVSPEGVLVAQTSEGDSLLFLSHEVSGTVSAFAVPEPGSATLILVGVAGFAGIARRRRD